MKEVRRKGIKWIWYVIWLIIALVGGGGTLFSWMPRTPGIFYGGCAMLVISVIAGVILFSMAKGKSFPKAGILGLIAGVVYGALIAIIVYLCDTVLFADLYADYQPVHSSLIVVVLNFVLTLALIVGMPKAYDSKLLWLKRGLALVLACAALILSAYTQNWWWGIHNYEMAALERVATPIGLSTYTESEQVLVDDADFYVAVDGNDENEGSFEKPFATMERAQKAVREMDKTGRDGITIAFKAGEYHVSGMIFTEADSGTKDCPITYCAYGDGKTILNAGVLINPADFEQVDKAHAQRLSEAAKGHVVCVDLGKYGVSSEELGQMHALGEYNTSDKYDGYSQGYNCELFIDGNRQTIARYPNEGWLKAGEVLDHGEPMEPNDLGIPVEGWDELRNPRGETYAVSQELADHINTWKDLDNVWMYGYFTADWAPTSTPIGAFDYENRTLQNKFVSMFDTRSGANVADYYFYNVFEELDASGEYYVDLENAILYLYLPENAEEKEIMLTVSEDTMFEGKNVEYLTLRGFTIQGSRGDAFDMVGNNITIDACLIQNLGGHGVYMDGYNNLISNNEITHTGAYAVEIHGGDEETLTPGNSKAYNNLIHDWGEAGSGALHGIILRGTGNTAAHNEMYNFKDVAINFMGNDLIVEYNLIHDVSLESSDAGGIYGFGSWSEYGCIVRYNAVFNIGQLGYSTPNGIYLDDGRSGQQVYGNLLVNVPLEGIKVAGGRDNEVWGNVIINTHSSGIGMMGGPYYGAYEEVLMKQKVKWENSYKDTEIWKNAYPNLAATFWDETKTDDPYFVGNPANNKIIGNLLVNSQGEIGELAERAVSLSEVSGNAVYTMDRMDEIFVDPDHGDYRLKEDSIVYELIPDFEELPIEKMGRE